MFARDEILERLTAALPTDESRQVELVCIESRTALTRFAENTIHQNIEQADHELLARVALDNRVGLAVGNRLEPTTITNLIEQATEIARNQEPDESFPGLVASTTIRQPDSAFYQQTDTLTPEDRAEVVAAAVAACQVENVSAAGLYKSETQATTVVNTAGTVQHFIGTQAEFSVTASDDAHDASGWAVAYDRDVAELETGTTISTAVNKAVRARNPQPLAPGEYTVILEPSAVGQLLLFLGFLGFGGKGFATKRSFMARQMGEQITGENITITENPFAPEMVGMPFDYEGVPKQRVPLITNGVAAGVVFDRRWAATVGKESTGHALPPNNSFGPYPKNMEIAPGESSIDDMIATTENGVLITHFWYLNYLNPRRVQMTGTTLDGTFAIRDGKLDHPVTDMRATPALLEMFSRVKAISRERVVYPQFNSVMLVPAMKIADFPLSEDVEER